MFEEKRGESPLVLAPPHSVASGAQFEGSVESEVWRGIVSVERRKETLITVRDKPELVGTQGSV